MKTMGLICRKGLVTALILLSAFWGSLMAQAPGKISYQAVVRGGDQEPLASQAVSFRFSILDAAETVLYTETRSATTSELGMVNLVLGEDNPESLAGLDWGSQQFSLKVELDPQGGSNYTLSEIRPLLSVPYALYGRDEDHDPANEIQDLQLSGNILTITKNGTATAIDLSPYLDNPGWIKLGSDTLRYPGSVTVGNSSPYGSKLAVQGDDLGTEAPLFEVRRNDGQTVFAVYNDGVRVYVEDDTGKGTKGGFAVGGFTPGKGATDEFLRVTPDSVRIYVADDALKGTKGGFAVGGFTPHKGLTNEYLRISPDSVRVYIDDGLTKGTKGGFAVGGFTPHKGSGNQYFNVSGKSDAEIILPSENRVLWYPRSNALLTGKVIVQHPDSVGINSMATGFESKALGDYSQAFGYQAIARGDYSTAIGKNAVAHQQNSFALGINARALGFNTFAFGYATTARLQDSYAFGSAATADGAASYAFGAGSYTGYYGAYAFGSNAKAYAYSSIAFGNACEANGQASVAMGYQSGAMSGYDIALGIQAVASGINSMALGSNTASTGKYATALGYMTTAQSYNSLVLGRYNEIRGNTTSWVSTDPLFVVGMGSGTTARQNAMEIRKNGEVYFSENIWMKEGGTWTGANLISLTGASQDGNIDVYRDGFVTCRLAGNGNSFVNGGNFGVGIGTPGEKLDVYNGNIRIYSGAPLLRFYESDTYKNWYLGGDGSNIWFGENSTSSTYRRLTIEAGGYVGIGTSDPIENLHVAGDAYISNKLFVGEQLYQRVDGTSQGWHRLDDQDGNDAAQWYETTYVPSDIRLKSDVQPIDGALEKINRLQGVTYAWSPEGMDYFSAGLDGVIAGPNSTTEEDEEIREQLRDQLAYKFSGKNMGLIAQDVREVVPEVVRETGNGYMRISYGSLVGLTIEAIKEQQRTIVALQGRIEALENENRELDRLKEEMEALKHLVLEQQVMETAQKEE